jgi:outer membrane protein assembly factor BamB
MDRTTNQKAGSDATADVQAAEIVREYGPFPDAPHVHGVTFDGTNVWFAAGDTLRAFDPSSGKGVRSIDVASHAGTAFDGRYFYQLADARIQKIDSRTGAVVATIPSPGKGLDSGLTWAEGTLWVGQYRDRKIHQIDPQTGAILRTIESNSFVTGVTWVDGEFWHGTWEGEQSDIRRIDPKSGEVLARLTMPEGVGVSGLESDGGDLFYAGGGPSGKVRAVRRPRQLR